MPKNYAKAILRYIKKNSFLAKELLEEYSFKKFLNRIEDKKDKIISIKEFKLLFSD